MRKTHDHTTDEGKKALAEACIVAGEKRGVDPGAVYEQAIAEAQRAATKRSTYTPSALAHFAALRVADREWKHQDHHEPGDNLFKHLEAPLDICEVATIDTLGTFAWDFYLALYTGYEKARGIVAVRRALQTNTTTPYIGYRTDGRTLSSNPTTTPPQEEETSHREYDSSIHHRTARERTERDAV